MDVTLNLTVQQACFVYLGLMKMRDEYEELARAEGQAEQKGKLWGYASECEKLAKNSALQMPQPTRVNA